MNKNVAIKIQNLSKIYKLYDTPIDRLKEALNPVRRKYHKDFHALENVSFEIKKGETVGIIGKNGSGKSTLLKMITGVLTPSSGRIIVHGKISAILELGAGFNPELTGIENIYLNTAINGMSKDETDIQIKEIIEFSELNEFIYQPLKTYSSGMRARLAFSVAISVEPDIFIVDEALSVGDTAFRRKCYARMEEIRQNGVTILFVSHSEGSIINLCSRAIWLSNGKQILDGEPKLVTSLYMKNSNKEKIDKEIIQKELGQLELKKIEPTKPNIGSKNSKFKSNSIIEEYYDENLIPSSTIYYEEKGAKISDVKITTLDGKKVNNLLHNNDYIYSYKVKLTKVIENLEVSFLIKNKMGIGIGGGKYTVPKLGLEVDNILISVKWKFTCLFNPNDYFLNSGVSINGEYLDRVIDAYIFKVMPIQEKISTGHINCILNCDVQTINEEK